MYLLGHYEEVTDPYLYGYSIDVSRAVSRDGEGEEEEGADIVG